MRTVLIAAFICAALAAAPSRAQTPDVAELAPGVPAGTYRLDRYHASLLFRVNHMGFSHYTARFTRFDAELVFDPADPAASRLTATVDATSLETDFPFPDQLDFDAELQGDSWLDTAKYPEMRYRSTGVTMTGPDTARIDGELTLHGATHPVALTATFNGGYPGMSMDPNARIGVSARGTLDRSAFGMKYGIPPAGTNLGVSDAVEVIIEAEFSGPAWAGAAESR